MRRAALVVFPGLVAFSLIVPSLAGRVFWTVSIAALPLFFVIAGYHRWRRICPLAFIAQAPARLGRAGPRRAGRWLQAHAYHVSFGLLLGALWLRLVATNGDGYALAAFLTALCIAAFASGLVFTGKTWCNYICPVSFVEKLYTEPRNLRDTPNSQCDKCTACKPACPDINEESAHWKEILLPAKRDVYYAFPGVVFAFYFFYYLQAGTWDYYFGGRWTNQIGLVATAFLPGSDAGTAGFFFWPAVPRAAAAAITLLAGGTLSLALFRLIERRLGARLRHRLAGDGEATVRHVMFTIAAFAAFVTFYSFAGAPTLRLVPGLPHVFQLIVVTTAAMFLVRRLGRRQTAFAEETLARRIIARWPWPEAPPRDLREAFLVHTIRSQSQEAAHSQALELYRNAVRDTVASGIVSRDEVHRLETIRNQMRISEAEHERVMAELADEHGDLGEAVIVSPEKHLQLETYTEALAVLLERQRTLGAADDAVIRALRVEYGVTEEEHAAVLDHLVRSREGIARHLIDAPVTIEISAAAIEQVRPIPSPAARFLTAVLRRRWARAIEGLLQAVQGAPELIPAIRQALLSPDPTARAAAIAALGVRISPATAAHLELAQQRARQALGEHPRLADSLRAQFASADPYVRAAAFYTLESLDQLIEADYAALERDEHPVVREVVDVARRCASGRTIAAEPTVLSKMIGLQSIGVFEGLEPEDLAQLARAGRESWFRQGETLCQEGELGDEVFVLLTGEVTVSRREDGIERVIGVEGAGGVIGELAVLDPAPHDATVTASTVAVRVLRLAGTSFRQAINATPEVSEIIIRMLARRLRNERFNQNMPINPALPRR